MNIEHIISRVTGNFTSIIDGLIRANGGANLFLINPQGIIFGSNASLDIGGSFLATTANSLKFADGSEYSASTPTASILTVSVPVGLGFGSNPGSIVVQGSGHNFRTSGLFLPVTRGESATSLQVKPGKTLALLGGDLVLEGGNLAVSGGKIELGSVKQGEVIVNPDLQRWTFDYQGVQRFADIQLGQRASVDASGLSGGAINIQGRNLTMQEGSVVLIQNQGRDKSGNLTVNVVESIDLSGTDAIARMPGTIRTETVGLGASGEMQITTDSLTVREGGQISSLSFSDAASGGITVNASGSIEILDVSPRNANTFSIITSSAFAGGKAGDIFISSQNLLATGGGGVNSATFGSGKGGNVTIKVEESVEIRGVEPILLTPAQLAAISAGAGDGGNLTINTARLIVKDGGRVDASTVATGNAGSVTVNASEFMEISGDVPNSINPSLIISGANITDPSLRELFRVPEVPSGASGDVTINTPSLRIADGALINARNDGTGDGGTINIDSDMIILSNSGGITAQTFSGRGGNISITSRDVRLINGGEISAEAGGSGSGGNIFINTDTLVLLDGSTITANALTGEGGKVTISALGVFSSPDSLISASSQLGIDGTVAIRTPDNNLQAGIEPLAVEVVNPDEVIAGSCLAKRNQEQGSFVYTGTGGIPMSPDSLIDEKEMLSIQPIGSSPPESSDGESEINSVPQKWVVSVRPWEEGDPIIKAQGMVETEGGFMLVATASGETVPSAEYLVCQD